MLSLLLLSACCPNAATWRGAYNGDLQGTLEIVGTSLKNSSEVDLTVTMDYANGLTGHTTLACGETRLLVVLNDDSDGEPVGTIEGSLDEEATGTWKVAIGDEDVGEWEASHQ